MMNPATFTFENLEQMILEFYRYHNKDKLDVAHKIITSAQTSPEAWTFVWDMLDSGKPLEVQFFAATTLQTKLLKNWNEVPPDQRNALYERLLSAIYVASFGPKNVLNKLCIAMAVFITKVIGEGSTTAIFELTQQLLTPSNMPPDRAKLILLQILTMLAEEAGSVPALLKQREQVKVEIRRCAPEVLSLLEPEVPQEGEKTKFSVELVNQALLCFTAWHPETEALRNWESFSSRFIYVVQAFAEPHEDLGIVNQALEALKLLMVGPNTEFGQMGSGFYQGTDKMPNTVLQVLNKSLVLMDIVDREMASQCPDLSLVGAILQFITEVGEYHTKVILNSLLQPNTAQTGICVIQRVLQCTNFPGQYPTEEQFSGHTFSFWYLLKDQIYACEEEEELERLVAPYYLSLVDILMYKSMYPEKIYVDEHWNSDTHTMFRCYRQDITDTMLHCHGLLKDSLLDRLSQHLESAVTALNSQCGDGPQWRTLEAVIHSFYAIAEVVPPTENVHIPRFLSCLKHLPLASLDVKVATTSLQAIGAYAEWLNQHPECLVHVIPLVVAGLHCEEAAPCATMTLKDLSRDCQSTLNHHYSTILDAAKESLISRRLRSNENVRLMYSVGKFLSFYPQPDIIAYLNEVLLPFVTELEGLSKLEPNPENCAEILVRLKMVNSLFSSLDINEASRKRGENVQEGSEERSKEQPIIMILVTMLPMLKNIATKWASDETVIEALSSVLKQATSALTDECGSLLPNLIDVILSCYRICPHPCVIEISRLLIAAFGRNTQYIQLIRSFFGELICPMMSMTDVLEKAEEKVDLLKSTFTLLAVIVKRNATLLLCSNDIDMATVFQWGSMCILLKEAMAARAATGFITQLVLTGNELPGVPAMMNQYGPSLVRMLLIHIVDVSTNRVEPIADLFLALNKKYCRELSQWLTQLLSQEGFPTNRPTKQEKADFIRCILKERVSKRIMERHLYEFALVCRTDKPLVVYTSI